MNAGQRLRATYEFKPVDHMVRGEFGFWDETINRWKKEGLPDDYEEKNIFNFDPGPGAGVSPGVNLGSLVPPLIPAFESKKIRDEGGTEIIQDATGRWLRILKGQSGYTYMPGFIRHAVTSMKDWEEEVAPRLDPEAPIRYEKLSDTCADAARLAREEDRLVIQMPSAGTCFCVR